MEKFKKFINENRRGIELKSAIITFTGIFVGMIVLTPAFNYLIGTDLPTIDSLKAFGTVALDTLYRALWITFLTISGLYRYRKPTPPTT